MELSELTQSQTYEVDALVVGQAIVWLIALCIVACKIVFYFWGIWRATASPYDEMSGKPHPADDVYNPDVWDLAEQYRRDNPERAYFPREKNDGR